MINLRELDFSKVQLAKEFKSKAASEGHITKLISESSFVYLEGNQPVVYLDLKLAETIELWPLLQQIKFNPSQRKSLGTSNKSLLFGAIPANLNHSHFCNFAGLMNKNILLNDLLVLKYSSILNELMKQHMPGFHKVNHHYWKKGGIHSDYQMAETIWTSGIINKNSAQNYHFDSMNMPKMLSGMLTLKNNIAGGYLTFPEYGIAFEVNNGSVIFFCGRDILHGVSPMSTRKESTRYSIVYYTTESLNKCSDFNSELQKANL